MFESSDSVVSNVINRILNAKELQELYVYGAKTTLTQLYPTIRVREWNGNVKEIEGDNVVFAEVDSWEILESIRNWLYELRTKNDFVLYVSSENIVIVKELSQLGYPYKLSEFSGLNGYLFLIGVTFDYKDVVAPEDFKVLAIMHFYNEADVLEKTIQHLLEQEVDIYLLDNWSDDGSYEIALDYKNKYPNRIMLERFPGTGKTSDYEWYKQLARTEEISQAMDYDWFIHYDADEIRIGPWEYISLKDTLYWIDSLGYNCVENNVIDFRLTQENQANIFAQDTYFDFRHKLKWFNHLKTWKKSEYIDLKTSGGHFLKRENPKVFPLKILNKHYPIRSVEQGYKKVFQDRIPRFEKERRTRGWHGHYDNIKEYQGLLYNPDEMIYWTESLRKQLFIPLFMEVGLRWDSIPVIVKEPDIQNKNIVVYGAGEAGKQVFEMLAKYNKIISWIDEQSDVLPWMYCSKVDDVQVLKNIEFDYIVVAVLNTKAREEIETLLKGYTSKEKIIWVEKSIN